MALKDALLAGPAPRAYADKVGAWRETLDDETRAAFDKAVRNPDWTDLGLAQMLTGSGFKVSAPTIHRYRQGLRE